MQRTAESELLLERARRLSESCPSHLGEEIAETGAAARGFADHATSLQLRAWTNHLAQIGELAEWLDTVGAVDIRTYRSQADVTQCMTFRWEGHWTQMEWQFFEDVERRIDSVLSGQYVPDLPATLTHAIALRGGDRLKRWQADLSQYPEELRQTVIEESAVDPWSFAHLVEQLWTLAWRGDRVALVGRITHETRQLVRILWAINRRWEWEDTLWLAHLLADVELKPGRFAERAAGALVVPDLSAVRTHLELVRDTLVLVPGHIDVKKSLRVVRRSLDRSPR